MIEPAAPSPAPPASVARAAETLAAGQVFVVHDDTTTVLAVRGDVVDDAIVARFSREARGIVSVAMSPELLDPLDLAPQGGPEGRADFAVSVDAIDGTTTGISAADRAVTIQALVQGERHRLGVPGHVVPVRSAPGGTLTRLRITEACVDLATIAGVPAAVAVCGIIDEDGEAMPPTRLRSVPALAQLPAVSARAIRAFRRGAPLDLSSSPAHFHDAVSALTSGVAAVTARGASGEPLGMVATSIASYTDQPPSVLVSVAHSARDHGALLSSPTLGIHVLSAAQANVATHLESIVDDAFADLRWTWDADVPRIADALVYMRCWRGATFTHHDRTILVADVELVEHADAPPLVHFRRSRDWQLNAGDRLR